MTVGVAVALYNGKKFIRCQLDCLRDQSQSPDKVVLCDDGSKDGTVEIVREYISEYGLQARWELVENSQNLGYARNFYKAMNLCATDLIFLCDQDDLWEKDKIKRMTKLMEEHPEINVLSCRFGIIDANNVSMGGLLSEKQKQTFTLKKITQKHLLTEYRWPGMLMCVRGSFFQQLKPQIEQLKIAHDRILAHCAAETESFWEFDYIGAYHRRHEDNTAKEEHRITKLLNLQRKLGDIADYNRLLKDILEAGLPLSLETLQLIYRRLELSQMREQAIMDRRLSDVIRIYRRDRGEMLRKVSLFCDIWLICFGHYVRKGE